LFTANDCLDIGIALGSPVSLDYYDKAPFKFNGTIERVHMEYMPIAKASVGDVTKKETVAA
jgi:arylsulfatase